MMSCDVGGTAGAVLLTLLRWLLVRNAGRCAATNVRLSQRILPDFWSQSQPRTCWRTSTSRRSLEERAQFRAVNEVNCGGFDVHELALRVLGQGFGGDEQSFVRATNHRASEMASFARSDRGRIPFTLEPLVESYEFQAKAPRRSRCCRRRNVGAVMGR